MRFYILVLFALMLFSCNGTPQPNTSVKTPTSPVPVTAKKPTLSSYEIVKEYKHDKKAFTQGLVFHNGFLYESTGQYDESTLRKVELETGKVLQKHRVPNDYFAEGMTILNGKIYQLTWKSGLSFVYNIEDFKLLKEARYNGDGWGLTHDGENLFLSDGTFIIRVIDPKTFKVIRTISVMNEDGKPLMQLNELEYIKGEIWANVWHSETIGKPNHIARIDPKDGKLLGWINLDNISPKDSGKNYENSLNGIAYDKKGDRIFVTGKNWKKLFEIKLKPVS